MNPPKGGTHTSHHDIISRLEELGYSTDTALIDAPMVGDHTSHLRWFAIAVFNGPNIKGILTPGLSHWPLPAATCLHSNVVTHGAGCFSKQILRPELLHPGYFTLSPPSVFASASNVQCPRAASSCVVGIKFPSHGQGPASAHNWSKGRTPPCGLCAIILCAFVNARYPWLTPGVPVSAVGDEICLVHGANTPDNVFLWCVLRGLAKHGTWLASHSHDRPSHMFEIWTSYSEEVDHGDRQIADVGFTVSFISDDDHKFHLHVYGYTNPVTAGARWARLTPPHVARGAVDLIAWTGQSCGQVITPGMYSFLGNCGHVGYTSEKETRVYHSNRPAPTLTFHMNALFLIYDEDGGAEHGATYLDFKLALRIPLQSLLPIFRGRLGKRRVVHLRRDSKHRL